MFTMEKYAVIKLASKQYLVHEGDVIELERQEKPLKIEVLFYSDGDKNKIGEPELKDFSVKAIIVEEKLGKKVRVARFKKKSRYERVRGHRQPISIIKIEKIVLGKEEKEVEKLVEKKSELKAKEKIVEKKTPQKQVKKAQETKKEVKKSTPSKKASNLKGSK